MADAPELSVVTPAHNEAGNLPRLLEAIDSAIGDLVRFELLVVDDGSRDATLDVVRELAGRDPRVRYISFSRNFGHQAALSAGLRRARGRAVVAMDADLQHPPRLLLKMIAAWRDGAKVVLTERRDDARAAQLKRWSSAAYYRLLSFLSNIELRPGSADFYLLDRQVVDALLQYSESRIFLRGLLPSIGFRTVRLDYVPGERASGASSYTFRKMLRLGLDGVLSLSLNPLRLGVILAAIVGAFAALYALYVLFAAIVMKDTVPGWASATLITSIIGAMQLFVLGVIGEYLGQVLVETRRRPPYIIEESNVSEPASHLAARRETA